MTSFKNVWIALVVIGIISIGAYQFPTVKQSVTNTLGSVPTLDGVAFPWVNIGGQRTYYYSQPMTATSSIACSIQNPFSATSTVLTYGVVITSNALGAQFYDVSTSSNAFASSTPALLYNQATGSTGQTSKVWLPGASTSVSTIGIDGTAGKGNSLVVVGPSEYLNFRYSSSTPSAFTTYNTGRCSGVFSAL